MRTLNHSRNEEYLLLWTDNGKLQNLFAKHSLQLCFFVWCEHVKNVFVWTSGRSRRSAARPMASVDFWFNEQRLPELRTDGTWKKKGGESGTNQSYNEVKVKANVGAPSLTKTKLP